jgi:Arc/MetJ-type ribon-helix-helix transcriptional regulator
MNRVEKITVSLPKEYLRTVRRALKRRGGTVSGYIATALAAYEKENELRALLDDLDRELGEPDAEARRWASSALK